MLNAMRTKASGYFAKGLMFLLVASFAIWGIGDYTGGGGGRSTIASVDGDDISLAEFQRQTRFISRAMQEAGLQNPDPRMLNRQVLRQMLEERLVKRHLHALGISVGDALLARTVAAIPHLKNPDGSFNAKAFHIMLRQQQLSEAAFLEQLKSELNNKTIGETVSTDDLILPEHFLALQARVAGETRDAAIVTIPLSSAAAPEPGEKEVRDFYEQQKELLYVQPERRTLEYAAIMPSSIDALVKKQGTAGDARDTAMQEITNSIEDALAAGKPMGEALKHTGLQALPRMLTDVVAGSGNDELTKAVTAQGFSLGEGDTSNLEVAKGGTYYVVTVKSITPAAPKKFEEVRDDVAKRIMDNSKRNTVRIRAEMLMQALKKEKDWQKVVAEQKLSAKPVYAIHRGGKSSLPEPMQHAIFERPVGEALGPLPLPDGDAMIAIITDIHPGKASSLDDKMKKQLAEEIERGVTMNYLNALANRHTITINDKLLDALSQQKDANE